MNQYQQMTDQELVKSYMSGCNEAFDCILARYQDRLYQYIFYSVRNSDLADDIFQETFVKAIVNIQQGSYTESGRFYSWLTRIAHNLIIDQYRQDSSVSIVSHDDFSIDCLNDAEVVESYAEVELVNEQTVRDVKRLMEHLPENQREVVFMRYYQDLSFKEIADKTGVSINTSLGRMRYAVLNMRRMAKEYGISLEMM